MSYWPLSNQEEWQLTPEEPDPTPEQADMTLVSKVEEILQDAKRVWNDEVHFQTEPEETITIETDYVGYLIEDALKAIHGVGKGHWDKAIIEEAQREAKSIRKQAARYNAWEHERDRQRLNERFEGYKEKWLSEFDSLVDQEVQRRCGIVQNAEGEAKKIIDQAQRVAQEIYEIAANALEKSVDERIDQMYGRQATLKRKRVMHPGSFKIIHDPIDKATDSSHLAGNNEGEFSEPSEYDPLF